MKILIKNGAITGPVCIFMAHGLLRRLKDPGGSSERYLPTSVPGAGRCLGKKMKLHAQEFDGLAARNYISDVSGRCSVGIKVIKCHLSFYPWMPAPCTT
ncbi:hypothetical protein PUV44_21220 [Xanthomonas arboricola pv. corylina]|nr:hypothetical protein PUV44_21220 [Xanthomonas arboricola pv. corylina]